MASIRFEMSRERFWYASIFSTLVFIPAYFLNAGRYMVGSMGVVLHIGAIVLFLVTFAALVRTGVLRLHARGKSGIWAALYYPALLLLATCEYDGTGKALISIAAVVVVWAIIDLGFRKSAADGKLTNFDA